jgi:hypothetical protein
VGFVGDLRDDHRQRYRLTIGSSDRGCRLRLAKEGVDDWVKSASFDVGEAPRRSSSSLDCLCVIEAF